MFADASSGDFHQRLGSPTINAGAAVAVPGALDFDREPRTLGGAPDIGADEFVDHSPVVTTGAASSVTAVAATRLQQVNVTLADAHPGEAIGGHVGQQRRKQHDAAQRGRARHAPFPREQ